MSNTTRDPRKYYWHDHIVRVLFLPFIPESVTPNHITVARFLLTPFVLWGLAIEDYAWSIPFFIFVAFTDVLDGSLDRVRRQVTEWGALYDPIADKLLISLAAIIIVTATVGWWLTILIIFFEIAIVIGAVTKQHDGVIMANAWGKTKMFLQTAGVATLMISLAFSLPSLIGVGMVILLCAVVFAVMSLVTYGI